MNKINLVTFGYSVLCGVVAGYFTHRALEAKAMELVNDGHGHIDAVAIGAGQMAITLGVGSAVAGVINMAL